jgi:hypothetical protein
MTKIDVHTICTLLAHRRAVGQYGVAYCLGVVSSNLDLNDEQFTAVWRCVHLMWLQQLTSCAYCVGALGAWESLLAAALGPRYTMVAAHALAATHIAVFVVVELLPMVRDVRSAHVATGVGNVLGNKVGIRAASGFFEWCQMLAISY